MALSFHSFKGVRLLIGILMGACMLPAPVRAFEQTALKTVTVMGKSKIYSENVAAARNKAISNALDSAVSLVTVSELTPDNLFKNFAQINEMLTDRTEKFIQDYKVLTETRAGSVYRVLVKATVSISVLEAQLAGAGVMLGKKGLPKVLFFITEKKIEDVSAHYWWGRELVFIENFSEKALAEVFRKAGFTVIDPAAGIKEFGLASEYQKPELDDQEAINLGFRFQADVIIIGRAVAEPTANTMGADMKSFKSTITARAVRLDSGQTVGSAVQSAVAVNTDEFQGGRDALTKAGELLGQQLALKIAAEWLKGINQPTMVSIIITGSGDLKNFEMFRSALDSMSGVMETQINEIKPDGVKMTVDFQGNAKVLASALMHKTFDTFGLNIYEILSDSLKIELVPRQRIN
jgi:hypothetical protein